MAEAKTQTEAGPKTEAGKVLVNYARRLDEFAARVNNPESIIAVGKIGEIL